MYHDCRSSPFYERIMLLRFFHRRQQENGIVNYFRCFSALIHIMRGSYGILYRFFRSFKWSYLMLGNSRFQVSNRQNRGQTVIVINC